MAALAANLPAAGDAESKPPRTPSKVAYQCEECRVKVWGKPDLSLICGDCHGIDGQIPHLAPVSSY
ncbi:hypothetical protein Hsar01_03172 [Haloferula sargassicola]|uniref:Small CPxCG-related zinc finger protein n=1 Tax=Haloferula sargassicola TaxID=490096 RepID=A0ABP9UQW0_9BACT